MTKKREFIEIMLKLNPAMRKVGTSDLWIGNPSMLEQGKGFKMVNMAITIPASASIEGDWIVSAEGIRVKLWRP